ncbi:MAG: hypothetical protein E5V63_23420, partial [Mesorhizobium sp.]
LSDRGHAITAIARNPDKIAKLPGVTARKGDVFDKEGLAELIEGHDAVVSSVHFTASDPDTLIAAVRASGVKRYLVVGGAGIPGHLQGRGAEGRRFPRHAADDQRSRLDLPVAVGPVHRRRAHRRVPPRQGCAAFLRQRQQHLLRGLRHRDGRRDRDAQAYPAALHGRLLITGLRFQR